MSVETAPVVAEPVKPLRWYQGLSWYHWWVFFVGALAWLFDCADQRIFALARTPALRQLLTDSVAHIPDAAVRNAVVLDYAMYSTAATMAGWAVGGLFFGIVGDRWGRVKTLSVSILVYSLFTGLCGLATGGMTFCLYRFLMGCGIGGAFAAAATLIAETLPEHARATCLGLFSALSVLGNMSGSVLARFVFSPEGTYFKGIVQDGVAGWRLLFFVGALPAFLVVFVVLTLKESEQWKAARRLASENLERQLGDLRSMFGDRRWRRNTLVAVGIATAGIVGVWGVGFFSPELIDVALTPAQYVGQEVPAEVAQQIGHVKAVGTLLQDVGGFLGILSFTFLATHVGRRPGFAVAFLGGFVSIFVVFMTLNSAWHAYVMLPFMGLFTIGVMGGFVIYFPEIFPTRLRSTGTAFGYNVARLSAAVVMLLGNNIREGLRAMEFEHPFRVGAVVLSSIYIIGVIILFWAPETRGQPLPDDD